jgi:hypothetical protein
LIVDGARSLKRDRWRAYAWPNAAIVRRNIIFDLELSGPISIDQKIIHGRNYRAQTAAQIS